MRILITGGAGFIGSHLAEQHIKRGDEVVILDNYSTGKKENVQHLEKKCTIIRGSVLDRTLMDRACRGVDGIQHLAANVGVKRFLNDNGGLAEENGIGASVVREYAQRYDAKVVFASSSEVYGLCQAGLVDEESKGVFGSGPRWAYAHSKAYGEAVLRQLPKAIAVRLFNVCGPRQAQGYVVSNFLQSARRSEAITVHGDGSQKRTFCHVADIAWGLAELMHNAKVKPGVYNMGGTETISMAALADKVFEVVGTMSDDPNRVQFVPYEKAFTKDPEDPQHRAPDTTKIEKAIGWNPEKTICEMILDALNGSMVKAKA